MMMGLGTIMDMYPILIQTKLTQPTPPAGFLPRPHLHHQLDQLWQKPLTVVVAPAGFGKSSLVAHWLSQQTNHLTAWLALDEADNNPELFLAYWVQAWQNLLPAAFQQPVQPTHTPPEAIFATLLNTLNQLPRPAVLALDDCHFLTNPLIHQWLTTFVEYAPPQAHLLLLSRTTPPWPLPRWRTRRQLLEIEAHLLRFSPAETHTLLNQLLPYTLPAADTSRLAQQTEGWVAGLHLAALTLEHLSPAQATQTIAQFDGTQHHIANYLWQELFQHQPPALQQFLLHTAWCERFCYPLVEHLFGRHQLSHLTPLFHTLHQSHLFVIPLDQQKNWYRYHHLWRDFLRQQSQFEGLTIPKKELWQTAGGWCAEHHLYEEAFFYWHHAQDWSAMSHLLARLGFEWVMRGQIAPLIRWLELLPAELIRQQSHLALLQAVIRMNQYRLEEAELFLQYAERGLEQWPDEIARHMLGQIAAGRAGLANLRGDRPAIFHQAQLADRYLPLHDTQTRSTLSQSLGYAYLAQGQLHQAYQAFAQSAAQAEQGQSWHIFTISLSQLFYLQTILGEPVAAAESCQRVLTLFQQGILTPSTSLAYSGLCALEWESFHLDQSLAYAQQALQLNQALLNPQSIFVVQSTLFQIYRFRGETKLAHIALQEAQRLAGQYPADQWMQEVTAALTASLQLEQGLLPSAWGWATQVKMGQLPHNSSHNAILLAYLGTVQLESLLAIFMAYGLAENRPEVWQKIAHLLHQQRQAAETAGYLYHIFKLLPAAALAHFALNEPETAQTLLQQALALAEPRHYIFSLVRWGEPMARLLQTLPPTPFIQQLLTHLPQVPPAGLPEPLTGRELEVLRLIAAGLSNQEIAQKLVITYGTTKRHVNNIYQKLGVTHRAQALLRAQEWHLL